MHASGQVTFFMLHSLASSAQKLVPPTMKMGPPTLINTICSKLSGWTIFGSPASK